MNKISLYITTLLVSSMSLSSCEDAFGDFLDKQPSNELTSKEVLTNWSLVQQFHDDTYNFLLHGALRVNRSWLDAATDLAENSIQTSGVRTSFNIGNYYGSGGGAELTSIWESRYRGIRKCNITLKTLTDDEQNKLRPMDVSESLFLRQKQNVMSEARFLRAWFYWELFLRYGPVPLVTDVLDPNGELLANYKERPSLKTYISFILDELKDCESGLKTKAETDDATYAGRINKAMASAVYSRIMLYMASPRYQALSGTTWKEAAEAAKRFIEQYGKEYQLETRTNGGVAAYNNAWMLTPYGDNNPEVIFYRNDANSYWGNIVDDTPVGEGGNGGTCPSQNLVDMYDMVDGSAPFINYDATGAPRYTADGKPTINPSSNYNDSKMWENRDPRLAATILYHGVEWGGRTINVIYGKADNPIGNQNATPTGYYLRKYIPEAILSGHHSGAAKRLWKIMGYNEILLNYAEALNEDNFQANYAEVCNLLDQIRHRAGITGNVADRTDLQNQEAMRNFIHKERTIELAFEEHRWWDVRRWNVAAEALGRTIYGVNVAADGTLSHKEAQQRVWQDRFYLYPIPETEIWKIGNNFQNNGWE